ncbi:hypothetical protein EMIHUDRAFT_206767 [Emiliania huxleyi CCMP1516]|uniref:Endonuclease/exonuclease/phosphatase domain-containing protein n=2 Tax=Emiliania huxleyi TaxID=2903 RepID=A0A0D3JME9_EMIH1|nr:hypothetical protein EMIHUDRAFT_206767 [Emiliania huxleyi CCMP1516]EOD24684.1 hypothetical protein EMIHUDRAFT_206767 [Emiliania huxleyi CCMP1516]|eukprot:XP_005777113.1 hypothetical protein EMIHUDRAFT_206767 [Emiliania huxleyi CCMP1516]
MAIGPTGPPRKPLAKQTGPRGYVAHLVVRVRGLAAEREAGEAEAEAEAPRLALAHRAPLLLGGDFNAGKHGTGSLHDLLTGRRGHDEWPGDEGELRWPPDTQRAPVRLARDLRDPPEEERYFGHIDWLLAAHEFAKGQPLLRALRPSEVPSLPPGGCIFPSDHYPVFADVQLVPHG